MLRCYEGNGRTDLSAFAETHRPVVDALCDGGMRCEGPMVITGIVRFSLFFCGAGVTEGVLGAKVSDLECHSLKVDKRLKINDLRRLV